jgi:RNA polymerase sigma-70 factor, ECF subfamily
VNNLILSTCDKTAVSVDYLDVEPRSKEAVALELYQSCAQEFGPAFDRLAVAYESDPDRRRDLVQEIHAALWLSLRAYDHRCSLRTWAYRVAHNTAASYVSRCMRSKTRSWVDLDCAEDTPAQSQNENAANQRIDAERLLGLVQELKPIDRQVILLYLEGMDSGAISDVTGLSATNVTTKIHRIKKLLVDKFQKGANKDVFGRLGLTDANGVAVTENGFRPVCVKSAS